MLPFLATAALAASSPGQSEALEPSHVHNHLRLSPRLHHTITLTQTPWRRAASEEEVAAAVASGKLPRRVIGIGLPHTGTTTLDEVLRQLGCTYSTHNLHSSNMSELRWTWSVTGGNECAERADECEKALLEEAKHFQCVSDDPWASHWRALAAADPEAMVVLTRSESALHYAITARQWAGRSSWHREQLTELLLGSEPSNLTHAMNAYDAHVKEVREAFKDSPRFIEFCAQCGEDAHTLARRLQVRNLTETLEQLTAESTKKGERHANGHPAEEAAERRRLIAEYADRLV